MDIEVSQHQGRVPVTVIRIKGNIDTSTYEAFQASGEEALSSGARYVLLDLTAVNYISSAGFRAVSQIYKLVRGPLPPLAAAQQSQGAPDTRHLSANLKLLRPTTRVLEALRLAGFDTFLEIHTDFDQAIASF